MAFTKLYGIWVNMKGRCHCKSRPDYKYYGGRGITVCQEWMDYKPFEKWALANGFQNNLTIERNDSNGNYEPGNCCFKTIAEQQRNKRNNINITYKGETKILSEWARLYNLPFKTLKSRLELGFTLDEAFTKEKHQLRGSKKYNYQGGSYSLTDLAKKIKISKSCLFGRLKRMSLEDALKIN